MYIYIHPSWRSANDDILLTNWQQAQYTRAAVRDIAKKHASWRLPAQARNLISGGII